jgi:hypothetical protein
MKNICNLNLKTIILGDFNLDQMRRNDRSYHHSRLYEIWKNFETEHTLLQLVTFTTWARAERGVLKTSLLDHIYTNDKNIIDTIKELTATIGDHSPVLATLTSKERRKKRMIWRRNWVNYSREKMNEILARENFNIKCVLVDDFNDQLEHKIMKAFDELVPLECQVIRRSFYEEPRIQN